MKTDYIDKIENAERRFVSHPVEMREDEAGNMVEGIASRVDEWYDLGYYEERVAKGAFDEVLKDDVRALFNHEPNLVLARTKSKTLELFTDEAGNLSYRFKMPDRTYAKDLADALRSGDVDQSSFAFSIASDTWEWKDENESLKKHRRTINKIGKLYDVSPVTYPASPSTTVGMRSIEDHEQTLNSARQRRELIKLKIKTINL
jgi:HK97 family phage prohead protease